MRPGRFRPAPSTIVDPVVQWAVRAEPFPSRDLHIGGELFNLAEQIMFLPLCELFF